MSRRNLLSAICGVGALCGMLIFTGSHALTYADTPTHEAISSTELNAMAYQQMFVKLHIGNVPVSEGQALVAASGLIRAFPGNGLNIQLVDFTRIGPANLNGTPCYIITIKNTHVPHSAGPAKQMLIDLNNPVDLEIVIDASSGQVLFAFAHGQN